MLVAAILAHKGHEVFTVDPYAAVGTATELLHRHGVGALPVSSDGVTVLGVVSERDIVRGLAEIGHRVLTTPVASMMTDDVVACTPADTTEQLMEIVTTQRIRHVPVLDDGRLVGLVSIGDIVAARVRELEDETHVLRDYITSG